MSDVYLIDGQPVNSRVDWKNPPATSATGASRLEAFPGSGITYSLTGPQRGPRVIVEGWLEAETSAALRALIAAAAALHFDAATHPVKLLGTPNRECQLIQPLGVIGNPIGFRRSGSSNTVRQRVRYVWQQLSAEGGTTS